MEKNFTQIRNILLAEDDDDDFYILNSALLCIADGLNIIRTTNGIMLSVMLETTLKPDLIILDLNLPFKNGLSILKDLKNIVSLSSTKIIVYSTSSNKADIENSYEIGADFYLTKPDNFKSAVDQLKNLFNNPYFIGNKRSPKEEFVVF